MWLLVHGIISMLAWCCDYLYKTLFKFNLTPASVCMEMCGVQVVSPRSLRWRHNGCDSVSNHQPRDCFLNRLFRRRSKKTSKLRATGLCVGNSPGTGEFPAQMASNAENVSIWCRHHVMPVWPTCILPPPRNYTGHSYMKYSSQNLNYLCSQTYMPKFVVSERLLDIILFNLHTDIN